MVLISILSASVTYSQEQWCGTDSYNEALFQNMSDAEKSAAIKARDTLFQAQFSQNSNEKSGPIITVPVVVHVMHYNCVGNISKEQIEDGIRIINEDFRRMNSDTSATRTLFKPFTEDAEIEFKLARLDPSGNCTEGIVRYDTPLSYDARDNIKALSYWSSSKYLNVWLVNSIENMSGVGITLGYAQFPGWGSASTYGLVVRHDQWGSIGTSNADGRTATHEVGHCFGLLHTFQSGCGNNCSNSGDRICDTPPSFESTQGCNQNQNTCNNDQSGPSPYTSNVVDQIENYMSYDRCQNMFSKGQIVVMRGAFTTYSRLTSLVSSSNLIATGTNSGFLSPDCKPLAYMCQEETSICEGASVTFTDVSYNGPVNSRTWSFPGGNPASSSDSVVTVTYSTAGIYNAGLTVGNASGSTTKTLNDIIFVQSAKAEVSKWNFDEYFEDQNIFDSLWVVEDPSGGRKWELTSEASFSGSQSAYLNNYVNGLNLTDNLISPSIDIAAIALGSRLRFKLAYARKDATSQDFLRIFYSFNCGDSWNLITVMTGPLMESVSEFVSGNFVPNEFEWRDFNFNLSQNLNDKENVRFKFEFVSGGGNNIYIDDFIVESITGVEENELSDGILIYPNPVNTTLLIDRSGNSSILSSILIQDISGKVIYNSVNNTTDLNQNVIGLDVSGYSRGIYFLLITDISDNRIAKKFIVK